MARRKINTKFLTTLALVTLGGGAAIGGTVFFFSKSDSAAKYDALADQAIQAKDWPRAFLYYQKGTKLTKPPSAERYVKLGDLARAAAATDPRFQLQDRDAWQKALEVDPKYSPALKKLLGLEWELARLQPNPAQLARVRELAEKAVLADPTDKASAAIIPSSTVAGWVRNVETDSLKLDADMKAMQEIVDKDPSDAETSFLLAVGYFRKAAEAQKRGQVKDSKDAISSAVAIFDKGLKEQDQNLTLYWRGIQVYRQAKGTEAAMAKSTDAPSVKAYDQKLRDTIDRARQLAKRDQPLYIEVNLEAATDLAGRPDAGARAGADAIYKDLLEAAPGSQRVRLEYANFLARDPATRKDAIELLSRPVDRSATGAEANSALGAEQVKNYEFVTRITLTSFRLDQAAISTDPKEKSQLLSLAGDEIAKLETDLPEAPQPKVLRGRLEMLQGNPVPASRTFAIAKQLMERRPDRLGGEYYDLLLKLADAYVRSKQTGPAKDLLRQVIGDPATRTFIPARLQLVQILAEEGDAEGAKRELDVAKSIVDSGQMQGDKVVAQRQIDALNAIFTGVDNKPEQTAQNLDKLPETTKAERIQKARLCIALQRYDEGERLLNDAYAEDPKDAGVAVLLIQAYLMDGKTEKAKKICATALEMSPDNLQLKVIRARMDNVDPAEVSKLVRQEAEKEPDPLIRELKLYEMDVRENKRESALKHLDAARQVNPDDKRVLDLTFQNLLVDQKFDAAEKMLPKLQQLNVDQAAGRLYQFKLYQAKGQVDDVLQVAQAVTQEMPEYGQSWLTLGQAWVMKGNYEQALGAFTQALQRQANNQDAMKGAIDANYRLGRPQEAYRILSDALRRFPRDPVFTDMATEHELTYGNAMAALAQREAIAHGHEDEPQVAIILGNSYMKASASKMREGDVKKSRELARKGGESFARVLAKSPGEFNVMSALAQSAQYTEDPGWAEATLRKAADAPEAASKPEPMLILAQYMANLGRADDAEKAVREAVRRGGTTEQPRRAAADLLARLGKVDDAIAMLDGTDNARKNKSLQQQRAEILLRSGRYEQAERAVQAMLAQDPGDTELQNLLTIVYVNSGRYDGAYRQIVETLTKDPKNLTAMYYRAMINLRTNGDVGSAVRDLQTVRDNGNVGVDMRMLLVEAYRRTGDNDSATRELRDILKFAPENKGVRSALAECLMQSSPPKAEEALRTIDEGLAFSSLAGDPDLQMLRARVLVAQGDMKSALTAASTALEASHHDARLGKTYLEVLLAAGEFKRLLGETDAQMPSYKAAMAKAVAEGKLQPSKWDGVPFWMYAARGVAHRKLEQRDAALQDFTQAADAANAVGDEDAVSNVVGMLADALGADEGIKAISTKLDGEEGWRYRVLTAMLHQTKGRLPKSLEALEPALAQVDSLPPDAQRRVLRLAGLLLVSPGPQNNVDRAVQVYQKLIRLNPDDVMVLNNIAYLMSEKVTSPNLPEAMKYSQRAVEIIRQQGRVDPLILDTHGWLLVQNGRVAEGINVLNEALSKRSIVDIHYHLGAAYLKMSLPKEANEQIQQAMKLMDKPDTDPDIKPRILEVAKAVNEALRQQQEKGG
jgi:tetratricopeptide (TPR) repeat protein